MRRLFLGLLFGLLANVALAQNPTCPTRPAGTTGNACASVDFVGTGIANILSTPNTWTALQTFNRGIAGTLPTGLSQAIFFIPFFVGRWWLRG